MNSQKMNEDAEARSGNKVERVLALYTKLMNGALVSKSEEAQRYGVNERSIQRDIDDIRNFMDQSVEDSGVVNSVVYDRAMKGFRLEKIYQLKFSNSEILALCKILLDSRAFTKREMDLMLEKLITCCVPETNRRMVTDLIKNEAFHYIEPRHRTVFMDMMWEIGRAIYEKRYIEIDYCGVQGKEVKKRKLKPLAIMFSEYYFYLTAFIDDPEVREHFNVVNDSFPTIYRIDRIKSVSVLDEHYRIPYADRFEEGEFRKRIQFMYGGRLRRIRFRYSGFSLEAVLDRLPTAVVEGEEIRESDGRTVYTISAEVFGDGVDMWIRSQGDSIEML